MSEGRKDATAEGCLRHAPRLYLSTSRAEGGRTHGIRSQQLRGTTSSGQLRSENCSSRKHEVHLESTWDICTSRSLRSVFDLGRTRAGGLSPCTVGAMGTSTLPHRSTPAIIPSTWRLAISTGMVSKTSLSQIMQPPTVTGGVGIRCNVPFHRPRRARRNPRPRREPCLCRRRRRPRSRRRRSPHVRCAQP